MPAMLGSVPATAASRVSGMDEFNTGKARADAELLDDSAACDKLAGTPRDFRREQVRAKELVAKAALELPHTGSRKSKDRLTTLRMDSIHNRAPTPCCDKVGTAKAGCTKKAQTAQAKAQADLRLSQQATEAKRATTNDRRGAESKLAAETCDAMAEDLRAALTVAAKPGQR